MRRTGVVMLVLGWLLIAGLLWWGFDRHLNPNAELGTDTTHGPVLLKRGPDGHYVAPGLINGQPVTFLVDTGASHVAIPLGTAQKLGLQSHRAQRSHTANGEVVTYATRLDSVALGGLAARDVAGSILPSMPGDAVLLGMSFLSRFHISMRNDEMLIQPQ